MVTFKEAIGASILALSALCSSTACAQSVADFYRGKTISMPGTPPERVQALRRAFDATMKDPAFLEEAAKSAMDISASTGEEAQKFSDMIANTSPAVIARAKVILDVK